MCKWKSLYLVFVSEVNGEQGGTGCCCCSPGQNGGEAPWWSPLAPATVGWSSCSAAAGARVGASRAGSGKPRARPAAVWRGGGGFISAERRHERRRVAPPPWIRGGVRRRVRAGEEQSPVLFGRERDERRLEGNLGIREKLTGYLTV